MVVVYITAHCTHKGSCMIMAPSGNMHVVGVSVDPRAVAPLQLGMYTLWSAPNSCASRTCPPSDALSQMHSEQMHINSYGSVPAATPLEVCFSSRCSAVQLQLATCTSIYNSTRNPVYTRLLFRCTTYPCHLACVLSNRTWSLRTALQFGDSLGQLSRVQHSGSHS